MDTSPRNNSSPQSPAPLVEQLYIKQEDGHVKTEQEIKQEDEIVNKGGSTNKVSLAG